MKKTTSQQRTIFIVVALCVILIGIIMLRNSFSSIGQGIHLGERPANLYINLETQDFATLPILDQRSVNLTLPLSAQDPAPQNYTLNFTRRDADSFNLTLTNTAQGIVIARDTFFTTIPDEHVFFYVNQQDPLPDLRIDVENDQFILTSPHYVSPDNSQIQLFDDQDQILPPVINIQSPITFKVESRSSAVPVLSVAGPQNSLVQRSSQNDSAQQTAIATFEFTPPRASGAFIIDINSTVGRQETHAYYTFTAGDVFYATNRENTPSILITREPEILGVVNVTFISTTQLQPFSPPCLPQTNHSFEKLFSIENRDHSRSTGVNNIVRALGFNAQTQELELWNRGTTPDDLRVAEPFKGYFIKLLQATATNTTISYSCTLESVEPVSSPARPNDDARLFTLHAGWNLISLPGLVPKPLTHFLDRGEFSLFDCSVNEQCTQQNVETPLLPGRTYWVYVEETQTFRYRLEPLEPQ
ncbi:hypothetical protein HYV86_07445 [Candidatus Woesearchaeota archaeon]|nr:hypothetical protein [Candidatus Woesearchaeota archaeon]